MQYSTLWSHMVALCREQTEMCYSLKWIILFFFVKTFSMNQLNRFTKLISLIYRYSYFSHIRLIHFSASLTRWRNYPVMVVNGKLQKLIIAHKSYGSLLWYCHGAFWSLKAPFLVHCNFIKKHVQNVIQNRIFCVSQSTVSHTRLAVKAHYLFIFGHLCIAIVVLIL